MQSNNGSRTEKVNKKEASTMKKTRKCCGCSGVKMGDLSKLSASQLAARIRELQNDPEFVKEIKHFIKSET